MAVFGTLYGFLSALVVAVLVVVALRLLISGRATADLRGNKFALGQDKANDTLAELKAMVSDLRNELKAEISAVQFDLWEQQIRDPNIHIAQRAKVFGKYEARGGSNRELSVYFDAIIKPLLEKYYSEQCVVDA
jgi:hypothetical protein